MPATRGEGSLLSWRRVLLALGALAVLLVAVWWIEVHLEDRRLERRERESRVFPFPSKEVTEIELRTPPGTILLGKTEDPGKPGSRGWRILQPYEAPAEARKVAAILWQIDSLRRREELPEIPQGAGLGPGEGITLTARTGDGRQASVRIGREVPTDLPAAYARLPDGPAFLVEREALLAVDVDPNQIRLRRLAPFEPGKVLRMEWERSKSRSRVVVGRESVDLQDWSILEPVRAAASPAMVEEVSSMLSGLSGVGIAAESGEIASEDLERWGLAEPGAVARVDDADGHRWVVAFGGLADAPGDRTQPDDPDQPPPYFVYARAPGEAVWVVPGDILRKVNVPLLAWRDRRAARVARWNIERIEVRGSVEGENWVLERDEERQWSSPQLPGALLTWEDVEPLFDAVLAPQFLAFYDPEKPDSKAPSADAFESPYLDVRIELQDGPSTGYVLGARLPDQPRLRWARLPREGETGLVQYGHGAKALREWEKFFRGRGAPD